MAKTNLQYLQELLRDNDEAIEWLDGLKEEYTDEISELKEQKSDLKDQVSDLEEKQCDRVIDFGYGELHYKNPDNLRIQQRMEDMNARITGIPGHLFS